MSSLLERFPCEIMIELFDIVRLYNALCPESCSPITICVMRKVNDAMAAQEVTIPLSANTKDRYRVTVDFTNESQGPITLFGSGNDIIPLSDIVKIMIPRADLVLAHFQKDTAILPRVLHVKQTSRGNAHKSVPLDTIPLQQLQQIPYIFDRPVLQHFLSTANHCDVSHIVAWMKRHRPAIKCARSSTLPSPVRIPSMNTCMD